MKAGAWRTRSRHTWYVTPEDLAVWLKRAQSENERVYIKAKVDLRSDSGIETRWVGTAEIKALLTEGRIVKCHEAKISWVNVEHEWFWRRLRNRIVRLYGPRCMRCGRDGQVYLDHIQSWKGYPKRRYDPENLQLLCRDCHTWKHRQVTEWDFRKVKGLLNENDD